MWSCCTSRHHLSSLTPALEWLLKPAQKKVICGPSPPKEFQAFPLPRPCISIPSTSLLHTSIWFLASAGKASLRAPAALRGLYHPFSPFCTKAKRYLHIIPTSSIPALPGVLLAPSPGRALCSEQEQSSACTAMLSTESCSCTPGELFSC